MARGVFRSDSRDLRSCLPKLLPQREGVVQRQWDILSALWRAVRHWERVRGFGIEFGMSERRCVDFGSLSAGAALILMSGDPRHANLID